MAELNDDGKAPSLEDQQPVILGLNYSALHTEDIIRAYGGGHAALFEDRMAFESQQTQASQLSDRIKLRQRTKLCSVKNFSSDIETQHLAVESTPIPVPKSLLNNVVTAPNNSTDVVPVEKPKTPPLLCCGCKARDAEFWCFPCKTVYCTECWETVHEGQELHPVTKTLAELNLEELVIRPQNDQTQSEFLPEKRQMFLANPDSNSVSSSPKKKKPYGCVKERNDRRDKINLQNVEIQVKAISAEKSQSVRRHKNGSAVRRKSSIKPETTNEKLVYEDPKGKERLRIASINLGDSLKKI